MKMARSGHTEARGNLTRAVYGQRRARLKKRGKRRQPRQLLEEVQPSAEAEKWRNTRREEGRVRKRCCHVGSGAYVNAEGMSPVEGEIHTAGEVTAEVKSETRGRGRGKVNQDGFPFDEAAVWSGGPRCSQLTTADHTAAFLPAPCNNGQARTHGLNQAWV